MSSTFLPITKKEALERGWDQLDFVYIIGDAYVDHPSFGAAIISRLIESLGFSIGIISQPVSDRDYQEFGKPKYAFLVTGGNIDSMVATTPLPNANAAMTLIPLAARLADVLTAQPSFTPANCASFTPILPSLSAAWRLLCAVSPITTTGMMRFVRPF